MSLANGSTTFTAPIFRGAGDILLFVMKDTNHDFLALHPEANAAGALGAAVEFTIPESGPIRIAGDFARANDALNAGNGVDLGI